MSHENPLTLQTSDLAEIIQSNLDLVKTQVSRLAGEYSGSLPASGGACYKEAVSRLRGIAHECGLPDGARQELLNLAQRFRRRADQLDRRSTPTTCAASQ